MVKMSWYKNTAYSILIASALIFSNIQETNANSGMMHPLGNTKSIIQHDVGQVINPDYGVINYNSGTTLVPENFETSKRYPVYTPYAGKVFYLEEDKNNKITLMIIHKNDTKTTYSNLDAKDFAHFNQRLNKGDIIGYISSNDLNTPPSLYYELIEENGYAIKHQLTNGDRNNQNFIFSPDDIAMAFFNADPFKDKNNKNKITPWSLDDSKTNNGKPAIVESKPSSPIVTYQAKSAPAVAYSSQSGNSRIDEVATQTDNPLCPAPIHKALLSRSEAKLANQEKIREIVITEPGSVNGNSCFDQFATIMSTVVAESGASGALNIFGFDIPIEDILELGAAALEEGACTQAGDAFNNYSGYGTHSDTMYAGMKRADTLEITQDPNVLQPVFPHSIDGEDANYFQPGARATVNGTSSDGQLIIEPVNGGDVYYNGDNYSVFVGGSLVPVGPPPPL